MRTKAVRAWGAIKRNWPLEISATIFLGVAFLLLTTQLRTLLGGYSEAELETAVITSSFPDIIDNLLFWPYYAAVYALRFIVDDGVFAARIVSAALGFVAVSSLFAIIARWYSPRVAIVGSAAFVSGSWFLQVARSGTPEILGLTVLIALFAAVVWLINRPRKLLPAAATFILAASAWFVPFVPWLMIAAVVFATIRDKSLLRIVPLWLWIVIGLAGLAIITALVLGFSQNYDQVATIFGIPSDIPGPRSIVSAFQNSLAALFWFAPTNPSQWLGNLPLLDIFGVVMVTLGVYHHEKSFGNRRSVVLFGSIVIILILLSLNGGIDSNGFVLLMPLIGLLLISGIQEFLGLWSRVFPRNPIAWGTAVIVITALVTVSATYQLNRYFIAWPSAPETKAVYTSEQ